MSRDRNIQLLLLRHLRDGHEPPELADLAPEIKVHNSALLVQEGRIDGTVHTDHRGRPAVVIFRSLTNSGHDLLDKLEAATIPLPFQSMKSTILLLAANPDGVSKLALDKECREIREKIRASDFPMALEFKTEWAVRPNDLLQYLNEYRPHIVHFSGHGSPTEELILHGNFDEAKPVSLAALKALFSALKDNIRLVFLNACYSKPQAEAIVQVVDCAVGMRKAIGDGAAIVFAASFYRALGFGRSVQEAFDQGTAALLLEGILEEHTPELLVKAGIQADQIFLAGFSPNPG